MVDQHLHPYQDLTPDRVLDAIEEAGFRVNGRLFPLNSYENRVYQVGIEDQDPVIAKFYRPERWTQEQLQEEHDFVAELDAAEIPVVGALPLPDGGWLARKDAFLFALYPQRGGQAPDITLPDTLYRLGQWLGRLHAVGAARDFQHRPTLNPLERTLQDRDFLLDSGFIPDDLRHPWGSLVDDLLKRMELRMADAGEVQLQRIHGDFHIGNILMREERILFVDFDDTCMGPAMQDIWLLLSGDEQEQSQQFAEIAEGYEQFNELNLRERYLIEPLRTYRVIHQAAWLAQRWDDPTFPIHFPWFTQPRYWSDHILLLREQLSALEAPPIQIPGQL